MADIYNSPLVTVFLYVFIFFVMHALGAKNEIWQ